MTVQAGLCPTWSETQIVVFLMRRLKCIINFSKNFHLFSEVVTASKEELMVITVTEIVKQLIDAHEHNKDINLNRYTTHYLLGHLSCKAHKVGVFNPYLTNGFSHYYHLGQSTFIIRDIRSDFEFLFHFSMKFL